MIQEFEHHEVMESIWPFIPPPDTSSVFGDDIIVIKEFKNGRIATRFAKIADTYMTGRYSCGESAQFPDISVRMAAIEEKIAPSNDMQIEKLQEFINKDFRRLRGIKGVFMIKHADYIEINSIIDSRNRQLRDKIFILQLKIHELFPEFSFDFKITISQSPHSNPSIPSGAIRCFYK